MPAEVSSVEWSSARGISDAEGQRRCPLASKNERNPSRISAVVFTRTVYEALNGLPRLLATRPPLSPIHSARDRQRREAGAVPAEKRHDRRSCRQFRRRRGRVDSFGGGA